MSSSYIDLSTSPAEEAGQPAFGLLDPGKDGLIRAELLGRERLENQARRIASTCELAPRRRGRSPLLDRFAANRTTLLAARDRIMGPDREIPGIDADWLADNFHIVDQVLREVQQDLPRGYDEVLPKLATPPLAGYPRVYALALGLIAHTDSELDDLRITRFVQAFQEVVPLSIGELWAIPSMLRLVLLENLRRLSEQMLRTADARRLAEEWLGRALAASAPSAAGGPRPRAFPSLEDPFVVRLLQLLRDQGSEAAPVSRRLEAELVASGQDAVDVLRREHRRQAANQVTVGNCVLSLRLLASVDWNTFFEQSSRVEAILREDPSGAYPRQDFPTSDRYRKAVERVARGSGADELDVARKAVELASAGFQAGDGVRGHVGYSLVDRGQAELKASMGYRAELGERLLGWVLDHPRTIYFGSITLLYLALLIGLVGVGAAGRASGAVTLSLLALVLALPVSELAVGLVNHLLTLLLRPRVLPKLEYKQGIPAEDATFIVIPTLLVRPQNAASQLERLEIHYLSNPDPRLRFALLTDFADAPSETMPTDEALVRDALERVGELNRRYATDGEIHERFFVFHRKRQWNPGQSCWMGWERKRGKLSEFNRLIRGDRGTSYSVLSGDPATLPKIRFVITLDSDTQMPRDTALRLIGTLAHPLNLPRFDPQARRVVAGYGVLQPRVSFHLSAASHSHFAATLAASGGIDPYSTAASDAYMDLFGLGTFTGKGIYELDAFEAATGHTFPDNRILSHDLIEGNYARCGLLSDTELFDDFPARYNAYARREHRWIRGDWQLLAWLGRTAPTPAGPRPNPLPALERWKLFDNLRRSLIPPALVLLFILGWTALPGSPWLWTATGLLVLALPLVKWLLATLVGCARSGSLAGLKNWRYSVPSMAAQALLATAFLPEQARQSIDAIARTLFRLAWSRRRLLEWETAASTEQRLGAGIADFAATMWPASALAAASAVSILLLDPPAIWPASPVLLAWLTSPLIAWHVSRPKQVVESQLGPEDRRELRRIARKTWHYFETFVGDEDHWLPPDNFQEVPSPRVAHRTSPTNQGLLLLSTLSAHDLGFIGFGPLAERLEKTLNTLERMEKHWGHFYNWYDTRTLEVLPPAYISTVDSGNLLGCLIALRQGLKEKEKEPIVGPATAAGLADTLGVGIVAGRLGTDYHKLELMAGGLNGDLLTVAEQLEWLRAHAHGLLKQSLDEGGRDRAEVTEAGAWLGRFLAEVDARRSELSAVAPWLEALREWEGAEGPSLRSPEAAGRWKAIRAGLVQSRSLVDLAATLPGLIDELSALEASTDDVPGLRALIAAITRSSAADLLGSLRRLERRADALGRAMDFRPLYRPERHLYAIGCNLSQGRLDGPCYDLLASESCLTSYLTVARGDAPRRHWFQLGRPYIRAAGRIGLISWGGTMFEYLMPRLMLRSLPETLLTEACATAVARQIEYGREAGVPWGISESAFHAQYLDGDYRYQAFGVPGLGLKRGLEKDLVIAPYASLMATMIAPLEAIANLRRLAGEGAEGPYGFYEAIDYTRERLAQGRRSAVVRSYMSHHQGMALVALTNVLRDEPTPRRFHADPTVRAAELLLQERVPLDSPLVEGPEGDPAAAATADRPAGPSPLSRRLSTPFTSSPRTHLLSNGQYHVMITNAGSGFSTCRGRDVTRWRNDPDHEAWGQACYVRDLHSGRFWTVGHQPACRVADEYEVVFAVDKATFRRRDGEIETQVEITVSPEQLAEVRRVTVTNHGNRPRDLELTSYAEIVLAPHAADLAHPAFGKLFLETEWLRESEALLCRRRPRTSGEAPLWAVHAIAVDGAASGCTFLGEIQHETDRARFLGRGRDPSDPAALDPDADLSCTIGPVLDPILSLRRRFRLAPGGSAVVAFTTAMAASHAEALHLADQYHVINAVARAFALAWAHSQVELGQHRWSPEELHLFQRLASHLLFASPSLRSLPPSQDNPGPPIEAVLRRLDPTLTPDRPILLVEVADAGEFGLLRQAILAHDYVRLQGIESDLVILVLAEDDADEAGPPVDEVVRQAGSIDRLDKPGGIRVLKAEAITPADLAALRSAAHVALEGSLGTLPAQLDRLEWSPPLPGPLEPAESPRVWPDTPVELPPDLLYPNGLGGFTADGREYCILIRPQGHPDSRRNGQPGGESGPHPQLPPAPWSNVVASPTIGFLTSEAGLGSTWSLNSQTHRLTRWSNDPIGDPPAEVVYLRDEATGQAWCPTPLPIISAEPTLVRHGQGYTTYERNTHGIAHELTVHVHPRDPVKLIQLRLRNLDDRTRRLSVTYHAELVLGSSRDRSGMHVVTEVDRDTRALLARNAYTAEFAGRVAFLDVDRDTRTVTGDRGEFLGRHGSPALPAALARVELSDRTGAGLDPCAAVQVKLEIGPGSSDLVVFILGEAASPDEARALVARYRQPEAATRALEETKDAWEETLGRVQVRTPDPAMDLLLNRWLPYQVMACRLWGRTSAYQSGGAYGFRDQLQDVMALVHAAPHEARAHILRAAARQFPEGDVLHWWHPPGDLGIRTQISDDPFWLPYAVARYVETTGDRAILDEPLPYLEGRPLEPGQHDEVAAWANSGKSEALYEHCVRALDRAASTGSHGLPLIGTGDWNDGMDRVGAEGRGESVWLAWFQVSCLRAFVAVAEARGDRAIADRCGERAEALRAAAEAHAWDGSWYLRAYFDDGSPLGTSSDAECAIDSIPQSWSVISGAASPDRARAAIQAVEEQLVRRDDRLILLLDPPFGHGSRDPGYIKGYLPGIRENGAQYTHAATWVVLAQALLGQGDRAHELFSLLNPILHADSAEAVERYKVEPYALAGDVFSKPPHTGRGGWTWYTGSAAWLYRVGLEAILGFRRNGGRITIDPRIPAHWGAFEILFRHGSTRHRIEVENPEKVQGGVVRAWQDGIESNQATLSFDDDGHDHVVKIIMGIT